MRRVTILALALCAVVGAFLLWGVPSAYERAEARMRQRFAETCRYIYRDATDVVVCENTGMSRWYAEARYAEPDDALEQKVFKRVFESDKDRQARESAERRGEAPRLPNNFGQ